MALMFLLFLLTFGVSAKEIELRLGRITLRKESATRIPREGQWVLACEGCLASLIEELSGRKEGSRIYLLPPEAIIAWLSSEEVNKVAGYSGVKMAPFHPRYKYDPRHFDVSRSSKHISTWDVQLASDGVGVPSELAKQWLADLWVRGLAGMTLRAVSPSKLRLCMDVDVV